MTGGPSGPDRDPTLNEVYSSVSRRCGRFGVESHLGADSHPARLLLLHGEDQLK
jgi:hypothetical protein